MRLLGLRPVNLPVHRAHHDSVARKRFSHAGAGSRGSRLLASARRTARAASTRARGSDSGRRRVGCALRRNHRSRSGVVMAWRDRELVKSSLPLQPPLSSPWRLPAALATTIRPPRRVRPPALRRGRKRAPRLLHDRLRRLGGSSSGESIPGRRSGPSALMAPACAASTTRSRMRSGRGSPRIGSGSCSTAHRPASRRSATSTSKSSASTERSVVPWPSRPTGSWMRPGRQTGFGSASSVGSDVVKAMTG